MPCSSNYDDYDSRKSLYEEYVKLRKLLTEVKTGVSFIDQPYKSYARSSATNIIKLKKSIDRRTKELCEILREKKSVTEYSLDLQIWWRDHLIWDAKREKV